MPLLRPGASFVCFIYFRYTFGITVFVKFACSCVYFVCYLFVFIIVVDFALSNIRQGNKSNRNKHNCHIMDLLPQLFYSLSVGCAVCAVCANVLVACTVRLFGCSAVSLLCFHIPYSLHISVGAATNRSSCGKGLHHLLQQH